MATQENDVSPQFSPEDVANAFVRQYYDILHLSPEHVHKFYKDTSTMARFGPDGLITVTTMARIKDLVASLACHEYRTEIMTADGQASYKGGVIVLVTGCLTDKDNLRQKFTETFFLAPQENGYYIHNDVFRFIDEDKAAGVTNLSDVVHSPCNNVAPEAETNELCEKSSTEIPAAAEIVLNGNLEVDEPSVEISAVKESVSAAEPRAKAVLNQKDDQPVADMVLDVSEDAPKKSYASILKIQKESQVDSVWVVPKNMKPSPVTNGTQSPAGKSSGELPSNGASHMPVLTGQHSAAAGDPVAVCESSTSNGNCGDGSNRTDQVEAGKGYSIYIGNLPYNASVSFVENEFKTFGPIRPGGVQVRCNQGFWFGFVEFEFFESMQKAIQASKLYIRGHDAFIQKKTSTRGGNDRNAFSAGGGRGGYRDNDGFRGRGNFSGGVGGSRGGSGGRNDDYESGGFGGRNNDYARGGYGGRNNYGNAGGGYGGRNNDYGSGGSEGGRNDAYGRWGENHYHNGPRGRADGSRVGGRGGGYMNDRVYQNSGSKAFSQMSGGR